MLETLMQPFEKLALATSYLVGGANSVSLFGKAKPRWVVYGGDQPVKQ